MKIKDWIKRDEGYRNKIYKCTAGKNSIGWGRNLDDLGISEDEAELMLNNDIARCEKQLDVYPWYRYQPEAIQDALVNMCFNMGLPRLLGFKKMISALEKKDYSKAALEALNSRWATQVGKRAQDIAKQIRNGGNGPRC